MPDLQNGRSDSRVRAEFWNTAGRLAWALGSALDSIASQFYELSGRFDGNSDTAGYWTWHTAKGEPVR
jgi:hypothetical protein